MKKPDEIEILKAKINKFQQSMVAYSRTQLTHVEMINQCKLSSTMLLNLINDLLDLAKQERLTFQLNK
jgi:signal transduction histidine kinase